MTIEANVQYEEHEIPQIDEVERIAQTMGYEVLITAIRARWAIANHNEGYNWRTSARGAGFDLNCLPGTELELGEAIRKIAGATVPA